MCHRATALALLAAAGLAAQSVPLDWRRVGSTTLELGLASPAGGPVERVWFSPDGRALYARTANGRTFVTSDYESWQPAMADAPAALPAAGNAPEPGAALRGAFGRRDLVYAAGEHAWRSEDGGVHWQNVTAVHDRSLLGGRIADLAVSPANGEEIVAAGPTGVWRSADGGLSWTGLNDGLPNLPVTRIRSTPSGLQPMRVAAGPVEIEWRAGEKTAWRLATSSAVPERRPASPPEGATVFWVDPQDSGWALAAAGGRIFRTANNGIIWDDVTGSSPLPQINGLAGDRATGSVYAATSAGLLASLAGGAWTPLAGGLPQAAAMDVQLNPAGHQIFVALEGYGIFSAVAPHRRLDPKILGNAAPGALLTVLGRAVTSARSGGREVPVLAASAAESHIQVPFAAEGSRLLLDLSSPEGTATWTLPLARVAPAIFTDPDGSPLITDAETGTLIGPGTALRPGTRLQILASGLGRVQPEWPAGMPAPLENVPEVAARVRAFFDGAPVEVSRATLAPGYVGLYLVEVQLPRFVNAGSADLYLEADGVPGNRVKVAVEP